MERKIQTKWATVETCLLCCIQSEFRYLCMGTC